MVDEAAPYFDEQFEKILNRVRQFKLGVVIAFQNLEQASEKLRSTIASSTAVKYAGGTGSADARWLAREMRCEPEFIQNQKRDSRPPKWTQFACHVRNFTDHAISLTVPFFAIEEMNRMSETEHGQLLIRNSAYVSSSTPQPLQKEPNAAATDDRARPAATGSGNEVITLRHHPPGSERRWPQRNHRARTPSLRAATKAKELPIGNEPANFSLHHGAAR